jgi:hypothetical protein
MVKTVAATMGYNATWVPALNAMPITERVLYRGPTEREKIFGQYDDSKFFMEYQQGQFPGLYEASKDNDNDALMYVNIEGVGNFFIQRIAPTFDGKTFHADLELSPQ